MSSPQYAAPASFDEALEIKGELGADARVIAGGTDLILRMRDRVHSPKLLVDLRRLSLDHISINADGLRLGTSVTMEQILTDAGIAELYPALAESCRPFAGPPIRNRATVGGNIVNASPAADLAPALMAYEASVVLASTGGERVLPLQDFFTGPGHTVMTAEEILTEVRIPWMPDATAARFIKLGQRRSMAISIVNLAARLTLAGDRKIAAARIALGAVAPTPVRALAAETVLIGKELSADLLGQAARQASQEISPISDVRASSDYRRRMTGVLVRRALTAVWDDLGGNDSNA
jgi:CO/xanthine dehydrogenase FAD-binding subunit